MLQKLGSHDIIEFIDAVIFSEKSLEKVIKIFFLSSNKLSFDYFVLRKSYYIMIGKNFH